MCVRITTTCTLLKFYSVGLYSDMCASVMRVQTYMCVSAMRVQTDMCASAMRVPTDMCASAKD